MEFLVGAALALFSALVVVYPFLKARRAGQEEVQATSDALRSPELESVYQAIRDLTWEHQAGEVAEDSYRERLDGYRRQAALLLRREAQGQEADQALEREVLAAVAERSAREGAGPAENYGSNLRQGHP